LVSFEMNASSFFGKMSGVLVSFEMNASSFFGKMSGVLVSFEMNASSFFGKMSGVFCLHALVLIYKRKKQIFARNSEQ
jgi:TRAP-type C4-dicarboxylate transport system permease large subunit